MDDDSIGDDNVVYLEKWKNKDRSIFIEQSLRIFRHLIFLRCKIKESKNEDKKKIIKAFINLGERLIKILKTSKYPLDEKDIAAYLELPPSCFEDS